MHVTVAREADESRRSFGDLVRPEITRAYRLAGYLLGDAREAEDAAQEAILRAWQSFAGLHDRDQFGAWLERIVVNVCRDRLRRRRKIRFVPIEPTETEPLPGDPFRAALERDAVGRALGVLSDEQRAVVVLRYWKDLSSDEIGLRLGIPAGTVRSRLHYAFAALRRELERAEGEVH